MKRLIVLAASLMLALTACGGSEEATPDTAKSSLKQTPSVDCPVSALDDNECNFAKRVAVRSSNLRDDSVLETVSLAHQICRNLRGGFTEQDVEGVLTDSGYSVDDAKVVTEAAVAFIC